MKILRGRVSSGYGVAGNNLAHVKPLICQRLGLQSLIDGTLNIKLEEAYYVVADEKITQEEYGKYDEEIFLQKCRINGLRGAIMRPDSHERGAAHGPAQIEILSAHHLRTRLLLNDDDEVYVEVEGDADWWNAPERD